MPRAPKNNFPMAWTEIDLKALKNNLAVIRQRISDHKPEILSVVKADAYGHGMEEISKALFKEGLRFFGVATIQEAAALRRVLPSVRILVLGSFHPSHAALFVAGRITPTISSIEDAHFFSKACRNLKQAYPIHVKIDTGMGRLGVWHEDAAKLFSEIKKMKTLSVEGIYTHFANADHSDKIHTQRQIDLFNQAVKAIQKIGISPKYLHASNSMGLARFKNAHFNLVRPGILLYGINPGNDSSLDRELKPVLSLKARVSFIKETPKGRAVSYGSTYRASKPTKIATLSIGYSHGYWVGFSNKADVIIRGRRYPVAGRVTMDQTLVDLGSSSNVKRWDIATLIGRENNAQITAKELSQYVETIPYEIVCAISQRLHRSYKS